MTENEETKLALLLGKVIGKQDAMHKDVKEINEHLKVSNDRLSEVEHQIMTWKTRFITAFALLTFSLPFIVEQSRTFIFNIIT